MVAPSPNNKNKVETKSMSKIYTKITLRVIIDLDDNVDFSEAIQEMDYNLNIKENHGMILDTEILDAEVMDAK